ncbi:hypothetical protein ACGFS9_32575 [Streptomyces sp. NPDC048566]|uniref:hypothetical protein n=1 Tax=Streptomyces sp. NPDC048566 TaxID=3365569 RepID=UPI003718BFC5
MAAASDGTVHLGERARPDVAERVDQDEVDALGDVGEQVKSVPSPSSVAPSCRGRPFRVGT